MPSKKTRKERMQVPLKPGFTYAPNGVQVRAPFGPPSVGLGAHAILCPEMCKLRPWRCHKCDGAKVPEHARWCEVAHPGYRERWEKDRAGFGGQMLKLATMIAARGERLPPFLMDILFDRDDPRGERLMYSER